MDACQLVERLPPELRRAVASLAYATLLRHLEDMGAWYSIVELTRRVASVLGLPREYVEKVEAIAQLMDAASAARQYLDVLEEVLSKPLGEERVPESFVEEAEEAARRLLAAASRIWGELSDEERRRIEETASLLLDIRTILSARRELHEYTKRLAELVNRAARALEGALRSRSVEEARRYVEELRRVLGSLEELRPPSMPYCRSEACREYLEPMFRRVGPAKDIAVKLVRVMLGLASLMEALHEGIEDVRRALRIMGERHALTQEVLSGVERGAARLASVIRNAEELLAEAQRLVVEARREGVEGLARLAASVAEAAKTLRNAAWRVAREVANVVGENDDLWEAFTRGFNAVGVQPPPRPAARTPLDELLRRLDSLETRLVSVADWLVSQASRMAPQLAALAGLAALSMYFSRWVIGGVAAVPRIALYRIQQAAEFASTLASRGPVEAIRRLAESEYRFLESLIPRFRNALDAAAFILSLLALAAAARGVARSLEARPWGRFVVKVGRVSGEALLPELSVLGRVTARLAEAARMALERLRRRGVLVPEEELGRIVFSAQALSEHLPVLRDAILRMLRGVPREVAEELAERMARRLAEELRGKRYVTLEELVEAAREALEQAGVLSELVERLARVKATAEELARVEREVVSEALRLNPKELYERLARIEELAKKLREDLEFIRENAGVLERLGVDVKPLIAKLEELAKRPSRGAVDVVRFVSEARRYVEEGVKAWREFEELLKRYGLEPSKYRLLSLREAFKRALEDLAGINPRLVESLVRDARRVLGRLASALRRLAEAVGVSVVELEASLPEAVREARIVDVSRLPEPLREIAPRRMLTLEEFARLLDRLAFRVEHADVEGLRALSEVIRQLKDVVEFYERVAREAGAVNVARELAEKYRRLVEGFEKRERLVVERYKPVIDALERLKALLESMGRGDLARLAEEAVKALPDERRATELLSRLAKELAKNRGLARRVLDALLRVAGRRRVPGLVETFLDELARLAGIEVREGKVLGFTVQLGRYRSAFIASTEELAKRLAELLSKPFRVRIRIDGEEFVAERRVEVRPGETRIVYRVESPTGHWAEERIIARKVRDNIVDVMTEVVFDPEATVAEQAVLVQALEKGVSLDPLAGVRGVFVVTEEGALPLQRVLEQALDVLARHAEPTLALLAMLNLPPSVLGETQLGPFKRSVEVVGGKLRVTYTLPDGRRIVIELIPQPQRPPLVRLVNLPPGAERYLPLLLALETNTTLRSALAEALSEAGVARLPEPDVTERIKRWVMEHGEPAKIDGVTGYAVPLPDGRVLIVPPSHKDIMKLVSQAKRVKNVYINLENLNISIPAVEIELPQATLVVPTTITIQIPKTEEESLKPLSQPSLPPTVPSGSVTITPTPTLPVLLAPVALAGGTVAARRVRERLVF